MQYFQLYLMFILVFGCTNNTDLTVSSKTNKSNYQKSTEEVVLDGSTTTVADQENENQQLESPETEDEGSLETAKNKTNEALHEDDTAFIPQDISGSPEMMPCGWERKKIISATKQGEAEFNMTVAQFKVPNDPNFTIAQTETPFAVGLFVGEMVEILQNNESSKKYQGIDNSSWKVVFKTTDKTIKTVTAKDMYKAPDDKDIWFHVIFKTDLSPMKIEDTLVEISVSYNSEAVSVVYKYVCQM